MWTEIGNDWKLPAEAIVARLLPAASNGAIFCLHDGRDVQARPDIRATLEAVRRLVPELLRRGYHFETVSEIL
jgi:peptidoglycan/xylan/chitin deacetylase (PgdA/CDA1 family)